MVSPAIVRRRAHRTAPLTAATALALGLGVAISPLALALPVDQVHDFGDGDQGWFSYPGTTVTSSAASGELCAEVQAHSGNAWDVALQHDGVEYVRDAVYTVSFDAHASRAVSVPLRGGAGWPADFGHTVTLDGLATPTHVEFTFTPADWPTASSTPNASSLADDWTTVTNNVSFQLGNQGTAYTLCVDNFSISSEAELLPQTTFADGKGAWGSWGATSEAQVGDAWCMQVPAGGDPWSAGFSFNGVPIEEGSNYTLSFTGSADPSSSIRVLVGENGGSYRTTYEAYPVLTDALEAYADTFAAVHTYPATAPAEGQVAFQLGGKAADYQFCIASASLRTSAAPPPLYEPATGPRVRVNQVGYLPDGPKIATLVTEAVTAVTWQLLDASDAVAATGSSVPAGVDWSSGLNVHTIDFADITTPGTYTLAADGDESYAFAIDADLYQQLRYDALNYFYRVRSGIAIDGDVAGAAYARDAGHIGVAPNQGDLDVPCLTAAEDGAFWSYGDWTCPDGYTLDVVGGWYDAGDHGKYVVNGGIAVAQLLSTYERTLYAPTASADALADGTLAVPETGNDVPDVLDEARWELEWMLTMQVPADGGQYAGMVHHKIHDLGWTGIPLMPSADAQQRRLHRPSTAATLNLAAVAAQGARLFADYDSAFAAELLDAARVAWAAAVATPDLYAPPGAGDNGGGAYDDTDVSDEFYWAAAELYLTTGEAQFESAVLGNVNHTADIFGPMAFDWGATAPLARMDLALVPSALPGRADVQASVVAGADRYVAWQDAEAFGTTYPGTDGGYDWGSNSMVVNNAVVVASAFDLTGDESYRRAVVEAMDYLLGRNALNTSYITGYGDVFSQNQHSRWFAAMVDAAYPHPPVGSLSGGPNSDTGTWDPTISGLYNAEHMCAPQMCYVDHIQSWATNEITVNWNSALSYLASFVADQGAGAIDPPGALVTITGHPADVTVNLGTTATFAAAATGEPVPSVQWQVLQAGTWTDLAGAESTTLSVAATLARHGSQYRAVFTNDYGWVATDAAALRIAGLTDEGPKVVLSRSSLRAGESLTITVTGMAAGETVEVWLNSDPVRLVSRTTVDGTLSLTVTVPASTTPGAHTIRALGLSTGLEATAPLTVLAAPTAPTADPAGGTGSLARTGTDLGWLTGTAVLMLLLGSGVLVAARVTRTREA